MNKEELLKGMFEESVIPTLLLDENLNTLWLNRVAAGRYPTLSLPQGIKLMLLPEQSDGLEERLRGKSSLCLDIGASGMQLVLQSADGEWIAQLITSMGWESSALDPQSTQRAVASVNASLRAPLAKVFSGVSSAARQADRDENEELFDIAREINEAGYDLLRFADNMTTYIRCVYGSISPKKKVFDICGMLSELTGACALVTSRIGVPIDCDIPDSRVLTEASAELIAQAVLQLISNSCRYTREGNRIRISLDEGENSVRITVSDRGLGIPADRLAHVVRPFYSWDPEGRPDAGHGLGLTIAQYLVTANGGTFAISSTEGEGTTAAMRFPTVERAAEELHSVPMEVDYLRDRFSKVQVILSSPCGAPHP